MSNMDVMRWGFRGLPWRFSMCIFDDFWVVLENIGFLHKNIKSEFLRYKLYLRIMLVSIFLACFIAEISDEFDDYDSVLPV